MERKTIVMQGQRVARLALAMLIGAVVLQSCKDDDVLTGQPGWLGNSVYERLQELGNYKYTLQMIDDLDQHEVLSHTGSKTLFVADDAAYEAWFAKNNTSYDKLTDAQKRWLFNNTMINNAYLTALMANTSGNPPLEGRAMRRETAASAYDSIYRMPVSEMPNTWAWKELREAGKSILIMKDGTTAPLIHFLPAFMNYYKITDADMAKLTNGHVTSASEAVVNGKLITEKDITCKNGYIHKMEDVIEPLPSIAEILKKHENMSTWKDIVERFSVPVYSQTATEAYYRMTKKEEPVYLLRYYNSQAGSKTRQLIDGYTDPKFERASNDTAAQAGLAFDPAWNQYIYDNTLGYDLHYDAGVMFVPTNEAMRHWWSDPDGGGKALREQYDSLSGVPTETIAELINVNMKDVFTSAVPSKFHLVLDDAKDAMGINVDDVDSCFLGCNGVVYLTNKVFTPAAYRAVTYPALAHSETLGAIYKAIDDYDFRPYLLSMDAEYALLIPDNNAMDKHPNPATFGQSDAETGGENPDIIRIFMQNNRLLSVVDKGSVSPDGVITVETPDRKGLSSFANLKKMLEETIDQLIIVLPSMGKGANNKQLEDYLNEGYHYFKTKGGALIYAENSGTAGKPLFAGGWQLEHNKKLLPTEEDYTMENGRSYQIHEQIPLPAQNSLNMLLKKHSEYDEFRMLMESEYAGMFSTKLGTSTSFLLPECAKNPGNFKLFDNYNYTVFVPTNSSIQQLQTQGYLPTSDAYFIDRDEAKDSLSLDSLITAENFWGDISSKADSTKVRIAVVKGIREVMQNFIRYHVQDHSVAVGMAPEPEMIDASGKQISGSNNFESMLRNPVTGRFFQLTTLFDPDNLTVTDVDGNTRHVVKTEGLYNNLVREYWLNSDKSIFMCSDAVVHLIDQPLSASYTAADGTHVNMLRPWREVVKEYLNK